MRKFLLSFALMIGIVISFYGIASADSEEHYFTDNGDYYKWSFNSDTGMLTIDAVYETVDSFINNSEIYKVADDVTDMTINSIHYSYQQGDNYHYSFFQYRMDNLKTITVNCNCTSLDLDMCTKSLQKITFNNNKVKNTYIDLPGCNYVVEISYDKNNTSDYFLDYHDFYGRDITIPANYGKNSHISYSFFRCCVESVTFASGTKIIPAYAFDECPILDSLTIPSGVTTIEDGAFWGCDLTSVSLPATVKTIRYNAFYGCPLETIDFEGTGEKWLGTVKKVSSEEYGSIGGTVLYVDSATVNCSDSTIIIQKKVAKNKYTYSQHPVGWFTKSSQWYYYYEDGTKASDGLFEIGKCVFYFDGDGIMATGWVNLDGKWYFFEKSGGAMLKDCWYKDNGNWYYLGSDGAILTGWNKIGGNWYYFLEYGAMVTGWKQISGNWYYFTESGALVTGWKQIGGAWYYFSESGAMVKGWKQLSGIWYYFSESGAMTTGWKSINGYWYYFMDSGAMATGWKKIDGVWYYFYDSGIMASGGKVSIDGKEYNFAPNGAWISD